MSKYCVDCKHFNSTSYGDWCKHPSLGVELIDGKPKINLARIERLQQIKTTCGPDAINFEQKEPMMKGLIRWLTNVFS